MIHDHHFIPFPDNDQRCWFRKVTSIAHGVVLREPCLKPPQEHVTGVTQ